MRRPNFAGSWGRTAGAALLAGLLCCPLLAAPNGQETTTREFQKTLPFATGQTLSVESKFGEIRIHGGGSREVAISATIHSQAGSQGEAEKFAESVRIEVQQDANGISVRTIVPSDGPIVIRIGHKNSYSVDYDIAVPEDAKLWKREMGNWWYAAAARPSSPMLLALSKPTD